MALVNKVTFEDLLIARQALTYFIALLLWFAKGALTQRLPTTLDYSTAICIIWQFGLVLMQFLIGALLIWQFFLLYRVIEVFHLLE